MLFLTEYALQTLIFGKNSDYGYLPMKLPEKISRAIWEKSGLDKNLPKAYYSLSLLILKETGEKLGENTLKRVFGYLKDERAPHIHTLDILARYLGFRDWDQIVYAIQQDNPAFANTDMVFSENLSAGEHIIFSATPGREVELEFLGGSSYRVIRSQGYSLKPKDLLDITAKLI